jgi:anti-repressor protein
MNFISEGDLYRLIIRSKLPAAERFERWVCDEVLPCIRKTGAYMTPETVVKIMRDPDFMISLLEEIQSIRAGNEQLTKTIAVMAPKAAFADAVAESDHCISLGEMAKILRQNGLQYGRTRMCEALRRDGFLIRQECVDYNTPTQWAMERGIFFHSKHVNEVPSGVPVAKNVIRVTGKGQLILLQHFQRKHASAGEYAA